MSTRRRAARRRRRAIGLILLGGLLPAVAYGQWIEPPGAGWLQITLNHHDTRDRFDERGRITPLFNEGGRSITSSLFVTAVQGLVRGVDVWVEAPVHYLQFNDVVADRQRVGLGDPRIHLRLGPALFGVAPPLPIAVRLGAKFPVGDLPVDAEIIPLTEGQRDLEVLVEVGYSFYPRPVYAMGWAGYRWRARNDAVRRKPGNERVLFVAVGGRLLRRLAWKLAAQGLWGETPALFGIPVTSARRRLVQVLPSIGLQLGPGTAEVGARLPASGQNLPAGPSLFAGYFLRWGMK